VSDAASVREDLQRLCRVHQVPAAVHDLLDQWLTAAEAATGRPASFVTDTPSPLGGDADVTFPVDAATSEFATFDTSRTPSLRYQELGHLGSGGLAEVRRALDRDLNRVVAMKVLRDQARRRPHQLGAFLEEAQLTARLEHPGIVPVHDVGQLPDGQMFFTMTEIDGHTFRSVLRTTHRQWARGEGPRHYRSLVQVLLRVAEAVAFAHSQRIAHLDLKPSNVMVGAFGRVYVVDWGLAISVDQPPMRTGPCGTPRYLAPEQADPRRAMGTYTDVYGLGTILYSILAGRPPYAHLDRDSAMAASLEGPPAPPARRSDHHPELPHELVELTMACLATDPADRPQRGGDVVAALERWLDGAQRAERAEALVREAQALRDRHGAHQADADRLAAEAHEGLRQLPGHAPADAKRPWWTLEDDAERARIDAAVVRAQYLRRLGAAQAEAPDLVEAHQELASWYRRVHEDAERRDDRAAAAAAEVFLRSHDRRGLHHRYLDGHGALSLTAHVPGARATLARFELVDRQLVPGPPRDLGELPITRVEVAHGSWRLQVRAPGRPPVVLPVAIGRQEDWSLRGPDDVERPLVLPRAVPAGCCYVPAGWATVGGDDKVPCGPRQRLWIDAFFIDTHPVTNARYLAFLDALVAAGRTEEALRHAPRERGSAHAPGALIVAFDGEHFSLQPDADGDQWLPDAPVLMIDAHAAQAFADWQAASTGQPWRLPTEWEWEKAARGVDARPWPTGPHADPSWVCLRPSHAGSPCPPQIGTYDRDVSPYGVKWMAGGVRDWCCDPGGERVPTHDGGAAPSPCRIEGDGVRVYRGGDWYGLPVHARAAYRAWNNPETKNYSLGFRLVRSLTGADR